MTTVIAFDPSFRAWGWAVVELGVEKDVVVATGVVRTKKSRKKRGVRQGDDDSRRCHELINGVVDTIKNTIYDMPSAIFSEQITGGSQSSRGSYGMGQAKGIMAFTDYMHTLLDIPTEYYDPIDIREALLGDRAGSKFQVQQVVEETFPELELPRTRTEREAICDALAVFLAAKRGPLYKMLRRQL